MPESSREEACKFIAEVRESNGGITDEDRDFLRAHQRESVLRALQKTRRQLADSLKILVNNLYSKDTRFLYELIQNADDNSYSIVTANGEEPFLPFSVYPDRIIIDSNEDGFSKSNIRAICSIGNSTKKHTAGYIGEKGIGFKSVFKIAKKVHINSGSYSFAFSYTREDDDDGLGMITPYYEDAEVLPRGVRTRMTLMLLNSTIFEERAAEFRDVPDTFLMFLNRLQRLSIVLYPPEQDSAAVQYSKREIKADGLYTTFLVKTTRNGKAESTSEKKYYTIKSDLHNLPLDEARKDKQGSSIDSATVILAFPVDEYDEPVIKPQYTYAFLPLRRVGFNFLIQADFVTQANREDVVHSKRNQAILEGVARGFADAMVVFSKLSSLKYQWMRYLPADSITDEFWKTLWSNVHEKLEKTPLLEPWSGCGLYKPSALGRLSEQFIAKDRSPLLPDLGDAEVYLSPKYTAADFQILKRLGTETLQSRKFLDLLDDDLSNPSGSKWKSVENADWRTRICKLLSKYLMKDLDGERLRKLALIPLRDDRWVSSVSKTKIYFPETDGIPIPADLGLDLVCPKAVENDTWADFFSHLGVIRCPQKVVISSIKERYASTTLVNFELSNAVAHIRYLYCFPPKDHSRLASQIRLANQHGFLLKKDQYLYFPNERDDYSPTQLFKQDAKFPGHPVNYLHEDYLKAVDPKTIYHGRPWTKWLEEIFGVRRRPELRAKCHERLSKEFQYIVEHRSDRLLGILKRGWAYYRAQTNSVVEGELRNSAVLDENGCRTSLLRTFLPFPKLRQIAAELCIADAYPFIAISDPLRDEERLDWRFVKDLQVGIEESLDFYLSALETFKRINPTIKTASARDRLARIYHNVQLRCTEGLDRVRDTFRDPVIWIQPSYRIDTTWLSTADCVWDGPHWLKSKQCLKLEAYLGLEHLFKVSLKTPDVSTIDVVNDLLMLKSHCEKKNPLRSQHTGYIHKDIGTAGPPYQVTSAVEARNTNTKFHRTTLMGPDEKQSFEELHLQECDKRRNQLSPETSACRSKAFAGLNSDKVMEEAERRYDYLWQQYSHPINGGNPESPGALRSTFEDSALVYIAKTKAWWPPSQCVWESLLHNDPQDLGANCRDDSLKAEAKGKASAAQIKETMALICRLGVGKPDFTSLIEDEILPLKLANGVSSFAAACSKGNDVDFAVVDNIIHLNAFKGQIAVLDFSLEDIRDTRPLLLALGLGNRFSSRLVKEITDVRGGSQNHEMTSNLRTKSRAIARCAFHFASPSKRQDVASLYRKFKRASVYVSDSIRHSLQITQGGRKIEGASSRANFHLEEAEGALRLHLPKDEVECDVCFESDLPRRLCTFLSVTDPGAPSIIGAVFRKDSPIVIDMILENAGVGQVDCDFAALDEELETLEAGPDVAILVNTTSNIRLSTPNSVSRSYKPSGRARRREGQFGSENAEDVRDKIMPDPSHQEQQREGQETAYKRILEQVVNVARQRVQSSVFESAGLSAGDPVVIEALPQETIQEAFATRSQEQDFKVGAAGELYMFETLKGLGLPEFGLENWKSAIRDRVKLHADYHDIEKDNNRRAIADIEYVDESRRLTQFLTQRGHLVPRFLDNVKSLYHIEIKTTKSSNWQEPFFMSKAQERHIQEKRIEDGRSFSAIYIICRIFNLGQGDGTGMHVYLDPETKRRNGELEFSTHTWAVKPLTHSSMPIGNNTIRDHSTTTNSALRSSIRIFRSSTPESQWQTESPGSSLFGSNPQAPPKGGLFGSDSFSANTDTLKATSIGNHLGGLRSNNASTGTSPRTTGSSGFRSFEFGSSSSTTFDAPSASKPFGTTSKAPSTGGFFGTTPKAPSIGNLFGTTSNVPSASDPFGTISKAPSAGSLFGTRAVKSSNGDVLESKSPTYLFEGAESSSSSSSSSSRGGQFGINPSPGNTQVPKSTAIGIPITAAGSAFGIAAKSTESGRSQSAFPSSGFGTSSFTSKGGFGTNATTSTSHDTFGSTKPMPTASNLFSTLSSSTSISETARTSKPTTSTATRDGGSDEVQK